MNAAPLHLLIVEDEEAHVEAIRRAFDAAGGRAEIHAVGTLREYREHIAAHPPDLALVDLNLPDGRAVEVLTHPPEAAPFPILVMTAYGNQQLVVEVMKAGALDYVVKSPEAFAMLPRTVQGALREWELLQSHKRAEAALRKSEEHFRALIENSSDVVLVVDRKGTITYVSPSIERVGGYKPGELIGESAFRFIALADLPRAIRDFGKAMLTRDVVIANALRVRHKDGSERILQGVGKNLLDNPGVAGFVMNVRDVTEERRAQAEVARVAQEWQTTFDATNDAIWLLDRDNRVLRSNKAAERIFRRPRGEIIGKRCFEIVHGATEPIPECPLVRVRQSGHRETMEVEVGEEWFEVIVDPIPDAAGEYAGAVHVVSEITERKRIEALVQKEHRRFNDILEKLPVMIRLLTPDYHVPFANRRFRELFGEAQGRRCFEYISHRTELCPECQCFTPLKTHAPHHWEWTTPNGTCLDIYDFPFTDMDGSPLILEMDIDITERKRAAEALRSSQALYRSLVENLPQGVFRKDRAGRFQFANERFCQGLGRCMEDIAGKTDADLYPPELAQAYRQDDLRVMETGEVVDQTEKHVGADGQELFVQVVKTPLRDAQGQIIGIQGIFWDITERKRAEEALREREERHRTILRMAMDGFWQADLQGRLLQVNEAYCQMSGYSEQEVLAMSIPDLEAAETPADTAAHMQRILARGEDRFESRHRRKDGSSFVVEVSVQYKPATPARGGHVVAFLRDITERKRAAEVLSASEIRYRRLFEAAKDGVLILDAETGRIVDVNPFLVQLLGVSHEAFLGKQIWELGFFKDIVASQDNFEKLRREGYIRYDNRPLAAADGRRIDVEFVSNLYQVDHHEVIQCNIRDIGERKRAERQAQIYREQLRALSARLEKLREEERTRISREIHDELGQMLTGIKMDLRWMEHRLDEFGDDRRVNPILDKLVATAELADATTQTVQRIAADLRPGILDKLGLQMALQYEAARFEERVGIPCRLVMPSDTIPLGSEAATAFFRIFQEALTNVTRHAKAKAVEVELQLEADGCRLEIRDDGQGMTGAEPALPTSVGLLGMQERARLLGGQVTFGPWPGGGTVVTVRIPNIPASKQSV